jgi:hypothetical protein
MSAVRDMLGTVSFPSDTVDGFSGGVFSVLLSCPLPAVGGLSAAPDFAHPATLIAKSSNQSQKCLSLISHTPEKRTCHGLLILLWLNMPIRGTTQTLKRRRFFPWKPRRDYLLGRQFNWRSNKLFPRIKPLA